MKEFLVNNYVWFLVVAIILAFAMIGYFSEVDKKKNSGVEKPKKHDDEFPEMEVKPGMTLGDAVNNNENKTEELITQELK